MCTVSVTNVSGLVPCVCLFLRFGGRAFYVNLVTWLIFRQYIVWRPGKMHLCKFYLGGFIPLVLVEVLLGGLDFLDGGIST